MKSKFYCFLKINIKTFSKHCALLTKIKYSFNFFAISELNK
ncbi:hypothetical protein l11_21010 [Neisseria weaveri LMG 5135]|nr:hypothetical protein l11_21010 [Neisseria weaveri LMG 5135]